MRATAAALLLLGLAVSAVAEEPEVRARVFDTRIVRVDREQVVASAAFEVSAPPGREYELRAQVRLWQGELLKQADGKTLTRSLRRVRLTEGQSTAAAKDSKVTFRVDELRRAPNFPAAEEEPMVLAIEFSLWGLTEGRAIADNVPHAAPLEIEFDAEGKVVRVSCLDTWVTDLENPEAATRRAAVNRLGRYAGSIGTAQAREALVAALIPLLGDDDLTDQIGEIILPLGEQVEPPLVKGLESPDPMRRAWCGSLLLRLGTYGRGATLALFDGLRLAIEREEEATFWTLTQALKEINPKAIGAAEVLSVAIEDPTLRLTCEGSEPDTSAVCAAIEALSKLGRAAKPAIPILERALTDPDENVRAAAKQALNKLQ